MCLKEVTEVTADPEGKDRGVVVKLHCVTLRGNAWTFGFTREAYAQLVALAPLQELEQAIEELRGE